MTAEEGTGSMHTLTRSSIRIAGALVPLSLAATFSIDPATARPGAASSAAGRTETATTVVSRPATGLAERKFVSPRAPRNRVAPRYVKPGAVQGPSARRTPESRAVRFAPNSFYTQSIRRAPLARNSRTMAKDIARQVADNWGGVAAFNAWEYNTSFYTVAPGTKRVKVDFHDCQHKKYLPSGLFDGPKHFMDVPVPADAVPARGSDAEMTIYDPAADQLWEFWVMRKSRSGWAACWGGRLDDVSTAQGHFPSYYGATATGLVMAGGMITIDDVRRGRINHAMYLALIGTAQWDNFSWPAQRSDGWLKGPDAIPEGIRLRLDPSLDVDELGLTPVGAMIAKAAQEYGFVVTDKGGAVAVVTESGLATAKRTGKNPWDKLLGGTKSWNVMKNFPWDRVQFLPKDYGKPATPGT